MKINIFSFYYRRTGRWILFSLSYFYVTFLWQEGEGTWVTILWIIFNKIDIELDFRNKKRINCLRKTIRKRSNKQMFWESKIILVFLVLLPPPPTNFLLFELLEANWVSEGRGDSTPTRTSEKLLLLKKFTSKKATLFPAICAWFKFKSGFRKSIPWVNTG